MYLSCTDGVLLLSFVVYARNLSKLPVKYSYISVSCINSKVFSLARGL